MVELFYQCAHWGAICRRQRGTGLARFRPAPFTKEATSFGGQSFSWHHVAIWHIPFTFSTGGKNIDYHWFAWFIINTTGLSIIMTWLYFKSSMSVIPVMLFHQGTNHVWHYFPMPSDVISGLPDWIVLKTIVYWTIAIILVIVTKGSLGSSVERHNIKPLKRPAIN